MAENYIYTMQNLQKVVPPGRKILDGIWLSFSAKKAFAEDAPILTAVVARALERPPGRG